MAKKARSNANPNIIKMWPTTILARRFAHFQKVNPALLELLTSTATGNNAIRSRPMPVTTIC